MKDRVRCLQGLGSWTRLLCIVAVVMLGWVGMTIRAESPTAASAARDAFRKGSQKKAPRIVVQPASQAVPLGARAVFRVQATGSSLKYKWQECPSGSKWRNVKAGSGKTSATYLTPPVTAANLGRRFRVIVSNSKGKVTSSPALLSQLSAPDIVSFSASPAAVMAGASSVLTWKINGATSVSIDPGIGPMSGTSHSVTPAATTTYTLTASNAAGTRTATAMVTVTPVTALPVIHGFVADPAIVTAGQASALRWDVTGASTLSIDSGVGSVTGHAHTVHPTATTTYTLTATNALGSRTAQATVTVSPASAQAPVINSFTASPANLVAGGSTTLNWQVTGARAVTLTPYGVPSSSSVSLQPAATTTYTLMAINDHGSTAAKVTVVVQQPQAARTWHVSTSGSDTTGDGSSGRPYRSIQKALDATLPEDTVVVHAGTYQEAIRVRRPRITIMSAPGEWAHVATPTSDENIPMTLYLDAAAQGCTLRRLEISGGYFYAVKTESTWDWDPASKLRQGSANLLMEDCIIHDSGRDAIKIVPAVDDVTIRRCTIYNSGVRDSSNAEGIDNVNGDRMLLEDSYIHHTGTNGLYVKGGTIGCIIQRNLIMHTGEGGILLGYDTSPEWFDTDANPGYFECIDSKAVNNLIIDTASEGIGFYGALRCSAFQNTVVQAAKSFHSALHFGVMLHDWAPGVPCPGSKDIQVVNNLFALDAASSMPMVQIRYTLDNGGISGFQGMPSLSNNGYHRPGGVALFQDRRGVAFQGDLSQWQSHISGDSGSLEGQPMLDAGFHLSGASPYLDKGKAGCGVPDDYDGGSRSTPPDPGADEYGAGTPRVVPPPPGTAGTGASAGTP